MEFLCFVWISEQTANFALHKNKRLVFITKVESVHYAVRTESLCNIHGGSNMTGTCAACLHTNQSRSYLNHLVYTFRLYKVKQ